MIFKSRQKPSFAERLRLMFLPRRSLNRSVKYYKRRVFRITASPHAISAGFAAGVAASITPFVGFHFLLSFVIAFFVRGNMVAAAIGTAVGNPITFPFIWATTFEFGNWLSGGSDTAFSAASLSSGLFSSSLETIWPILQPMLAGCLPLAIGAWLISYLIVRRGVGSYREKRLARLAEKRAAARKAELVAASLTVDGLGADPVRP